MGRLDEMSETSGSMGSTNEKRRKSESRVKGRRTLLKACLAPETLGGPTRTATHRQRTRGGGGRPVHARGRASRAGDAVEGLPVA